MKKAFVFLFISFAAFSLIRAQDCKMYFPEKEGALKEITNYNQRDKVTGKIIQEILSKEQIPNGVKLRVKTVALDADEQELHNMEMDIVCENGVFKIDMSDYLSEMLQAYQEMEIEMTGDNLVFPSNLKTGDELPDAIMNIVVKTGGMQIMNMDVSITDRKVESRETMTTDAGSFECYKIRYNTLSKTRIINVQTSSVEWISEGVGVVRTENYDKKGKLSSYSLLTRLEK